MVRIVRLRELGADQRLSDAIASIFFANAGTKQFASDAERAAYRELWLGRYMRHCPDECLVAMTPDGEVISYLAGSFVSNRPPLPGPDYYDAFTPELIMAYPAHIHVNVRADYQGRDIGAKLIDAFRVLCKASGKPGMHAVTAAGSRAAQFFIRCGLTERAKVDWRDRRLVFLAENLTESL